jgi:formamidase
MGCAPSAVLLETWNKREMELINTDPHRVPALACPPNSQGALAGMSSMDPILAEKICAEGARTVPPREHGGNCDIKNLSKGSVIYFPVYVEGAKLSMGDIHFSQGDGEISFCGAIEMAGCITLKTSIISNGMELYGIKNPLYLPGPIEPKYHRQLTFQGISVTEQGKQVVKAITHYLQFIFLLGSIYFLKRYPVLIISSSILIPLWLTEMHV